MTQSVQVGNIHYTVSMDTAQMLRDSQKASQAANTFSAKLTETAKAAKEATTSVDGTSKALSALTKVAAAYVSIQTLKYLASLSDAYQQNASRIRNATKSTEEYERVQARLLATANSTYRSLGEAQEVYLGIGSTLQDLGYTTEEVLDITDSLSYAFTRDAASADQASGAMGAYSKALAKGKIDADAWSSIIAASDSIIQNVAKATNRTTLEIQKLGAEGKLSLQALNEGLRQSLAENKTAAEGMAVSTKDATVQMRNAMTVFVGKVNEASGASDIFTENVATMAKLLQDPATIDAAVDFANGIVTAFNWIIKGAKTVAETVKYMAEDLAATLHGPAADDVVRIEDRLKGAREQLEILQRPIQGAIGRVFVDVDGVKAKVSSLEKQYATALQLREMLEKGGQGSGKIGPNELPSLGKPVKAEAAGKDNSGKKALQDSMRLQKQQTETAAKYLKSLQERVDQTDKLTNSERLNYDIAAGVVKLDGERLTKARALAQALDEREKSQKAEAKALNILNAELAAQRQLMAEIAGYDIDLTGMTMGDESLSDMQQRLQILDKFAQRTQQLEDQRRSTLAGKTEAQQAEINAMYDEALKIEQKYQEDSLAAYDAYIQRKKALDGDWSVGATKAWNNYVEESQNMAAQAQGAMTNALTGMEDALVKFVQTGKLSFKDLANSIIADLARIAAKKAIVGMVGSLFGAFGGAAAGAASSGAISPMAGGGSYSLASGSGGAGLKGSWSDGGYTGDGGKYEEAGIVHKGEGVLNQDEVKRLGGPRGFEQFRKQLAGYAKGGAVGFIPSAPTGAAGAGQVVNVEVNLIGSTQEPQQVQGTADGAGGLKIDVLFGVLKKEIKGEIGGEIANGQGNVYRSIKTRFGLNERR